MEKITHSNFDIQALPKYSAGISPVFTAKVINLRVFPYILN